MELRNLFPNEALDFTPWLAKNNLIPDIIHTLNLFDNPIHLYKTEVSVGDYRLDMIYKESGGKGSLIVENQYGDSDSRHLGQIIVYSKLTHIPKILWICDKVCLEHRRISESLNGIDIIPVSMEIVPRAEGGYFLKSHIYGNYNRVLTYRLGEDCEVLGRIINGV